MCGGVYLSDLLLHALDFVLPWLHLSAQLLDLVVQYKLELLQFLVLLLQVINTLFLHTHTERERQRRVVCSVFTSLPPPPLPQTHTRGRGVSHTHTHLPYLE